MTDQTPYSPAALGAGRILIVDDSPENIQVLNAFLKDKGYQTSVATTGRRALELLARSLPDLILLDIMMPEMDGFETIQRIKANEAWRQIPIIFLTAKTQTADIVRGFELGAVDYVTKPFNAPELLARVGAHLALDRLHRENERLLLSILPAAIAERLKSNEAGIADHFPEVSVLFADLVGFTNLSSSMSPSELVSLLDELFSQFDRLARQHQVEKIKTIGDGYMAVCGVPSSHPGHASAVAEMALGMVESLHHFNRRHGTSLQVRIGLNTGPVVAGVIGRAKFIYDLWGDTVNVASRMESTCLPDAIQVTQATRDALDGQFELAERGEVEVKGKGMLRTWIVKGSKQQAQVG